MAALALLTAAAVGVDVFRLGWFADDFHLLDVARRLPMAEALTGRYGIWPWYRPLSRELFFEAIIACGPAGLIVAHGLALATLLGSASLLFSLARRGIAGPAAALAPALFLCYDSTKFLAAWPSGFQDLLAVFLMLAAVEAHARGRIALSRVAIALAPFAKETGFLALPLVLAWARFSQGERRYRPWMGWHAVTVCGAFLVHVAVRLTWHAGGTTPRQALEPGRLPAAMLELISAFVAKSPAPGPAPAALAFAAAVGAFLLLRSTAPGPAAVTDAVAEPGSHRAARGTAGFALTAAALGLAPAVAGHVMKMTYAHAYHAFSAAPWLVLLVALAAARAGSRMLMFLLPALVFWNVWGLGPRWPDLDRRDDWATRGSWCWNDAVRLSAVAARLSCDIRRQLANRPESLVVLYEGLPRDCYFQTEDGPATREALGDPTVRSHWLNDPPADVAAGRLAVLTFNLDSLRLLRSRWSVNEGLKRAMKAVIAGRPRAARAFTLVAGERDEAGLDRCYVRAAATLLERGPSAYAAELPGCGVGDSTGASPDSVAGPLARLDPGVGATFAGVLRRPCTAAAHARLADTLEARGVSVRSSFELRIAVTLDPSRFADRLRLGLWMAQMQGWHEARLELESVAQRAPDAELAARARAALAALERARAEEAGEDER